jgi:hypothetical protein
MHLGKLLAHLEDHLLCHLEEEDQLKGDSEEDSDHCLLAHWEDQVLSHLEEEDLLKGDSEEDSEHQLLAHLEEHLGDLLSAHLEEDLEHQWCTRPGNRNPVALLGPHRMRMNPFQLLAWRPLAHRGLTRITTLNPH